MSENVNKPTNEVVYETDDVGAGRAAGSGFRGFVKTKRGKITVIAASALVLIGATAAAGLVGSSVVKSQNQGQQFGDDHGPGANGAPNGAPNGAFGYGAPNAGGYAPNFGGPDGDHKGFNGKPPAGGFRPDGDHGPDGGPDGDHGKFFLPNGATNNSDD
jgi:hypothetical protein